MAIFHETINITSAGRHPNLGMLLGTRASSDVFNTINARGHTSLFGSDYDHMHADFYERHVRPMDALNFEVSRTVNMIMNPDRYRILNTMEDFKSIPSCMEMAILCFEPVRHGVQTGTMEGFGYNPDTLPEEDMYGRLIDNFTCEDVLEVADEHGYYDVSGTLYSDDLDLNDDDLFAIRRTREFIRDKILLGTDKDPTAIQLPRG